MSKWAVWSAGSVAVAVACGAIGAAAAGAAVNTGISPAGHPAMQRTHASHASAAGWRAHIVLREPSRLGIENQVVDGRTRTVFALSAIHHGSAFRLHRMPLARGRATTGPTFPVNEIALGAGSVWIFGARPASPAAVSLLLYQVNPATLHIVRLWQLSPPRRIGGFVGFSAGRNGTVWVGFLRTILHINARTGRTVGRIKIGRAHSITDVAVDPAGTHLYVVETTRIGGAVAAEYSTLTGRLLAVNGRSPLKFSVGGGHATAVPGAVWISFRTGMLGQTVLLKQKGLRLVKLPVTPGSLFAWPMFASTEFAGHALFLARVDGKIGCMEPRTGHVLSRGRISQLNGGGELIGSAEAGRVIYATAPAGVLAINPPAACRG